MTSQAVVLGGGIAGLLAAAVLGRRFDTVVIVERDHLPSTPGRRPGIPQAAHVHALVARGQREVDTLVPGFMTTLTEAGAPIVDFATQVAIRTPFGWGQRFPSDITAVGATRDLMEWVIRSQVLAESTVSVADQHVGDGLIADHGLVRAVRVRTRDGAAAPAIPADLVVDATGRSSRADHWLAELGYPPPPSTIIDARIGYASRLFAIPASHHADWTACYLQLGPPSQPRGAVLMPVEQNRWVVTLIGVGPDRPTRREEDFLPFTRHLPSPIIADAIAAAHPLTPVNTSGTTSNRRRYVERVRRQPGNFIRIGDAVCCFNPVYAQGMTTAALAAALLARCLDQRLGAPHFAAFYHRKLAAVTRWPWTMATLSDQHWPLTRGPSPSPTQRLLATYVDRVIATGTTDPHVQRPFLHVLNMLRTPPSLLSPHTIIRVLHPRHPRRNRVASQPPELVSDRITAHYPVE